MPNPQPISAKLHPFFSFLSTSGIAGIHFFSKFKEYEGLKNLAVPEKIQG